jgi:hypothetical protein
MKCQSVKSNNRIILIIICLIFQSSCIASRDNKFIPSLYIPKKDINSDVIIYTPLGWNTKLIGEPVSLMVETIGKQPIVFSNDYGIEVFLRKDDNWIKLDLVPIKYIEGDIYLRPAENNPIYFGSTMVEPIFEDKSEKVKIRIVVVGRKYIDGKKTDQMVAAYTDIWLYPQE